MKKIIYLLLLFSAFANAQIVNIPDANFKARLLQASPSYQIASLTYNSEGANPTVFTKIDTNNDGEIQYSEAQQILVLSVSAATIQDLTGIEAFVNLKHLLCGFNQLNVIDLSQNVLLEKLECRNSSITNLNIADLPNLTYLDCQVNSLSVLNTSNNPNLKTLFCSNNSLTNINLSSNLNLKVISFGTNPISSIDVTQNAVLETIFGGYAQLTSINVSQNPLLKVLHVNDNQLTTINVVPNSNLEELNIGSNQFTTVDVTQNPNLESLTCSSNFFTNIDVTQNPNLRNLQCSLNQLTNINVTQNLNIKSLYCSNNIINSLNISQNTLLETLLCGNNQIPVINTTNNLLLEQFWCQNNLLTSLDVSQNTFLEDFRCYTNQISTLDVSQNNALIYLHCFSNQLTYLNMKNGANEFQPQLSGNPNLHYICADETEVSYVQSLPGSVNAVVSSYCNFVPGGNYNTVTGNVINDLDNDGCDINDNYLFNNVTLTLTNGTITSATFPSPSFNNSYKLYTATGNHTLTTSLENPTYFNISPSSTTINFPLLNNSVHNQDFCITPNGIHPDLEIVVAPVIPARPGFDAIYKIVYKNKGNQTLSQAYGVNFFYNENLMDYVSASVVPTSISSGGLSWSYANLLPFESRSILVIFSVNAPTDTPPVNIGDALQFTTSILPMAGDESTSDNTFLLNQTVVGAYDPNNISCLEGNVVSPSLIGEYLHYVINFENTGNYEAESIVVKTEINPAQFDVSSLRMLNTSHNAYVRINNNIVEFVFENIALTSGGHGNILLKIKSKSNLTNGAIVKKRADIFFDYNAPIDTGFENTVFQALSNSNFIKDNSISIYPNPTNSIINIKCDNNIKSIELFDVQGRILVTKMVSDYNEVLNISDKTNGIYFLRITSENGIKMEKLIKE